MKTAAQVREEFIAFFRERGHTFVAGSPVIPHDDPTLLFTNAGMNQFKPLFLGTADTSSAFGRMKRAANSQPCIRAGGKHNDLDDVGHDTYHHTFFEMLGNWSFGDYFKRDAIAWAWELLTRVWQLDPQRLHATFFGGDSAEGLEPDLEARDLWREVAGLPTERIHPGNKKDNFWEMGDTGPCGPCSEIHVDLTPDKSGGRLVNAGDPRVMEIWNLVFIQFNRGGDKRLTPLPARHVDTGMGLERITAILQEHQNNYATDVFVPVIQAIEHLSGHRYGGHAARPDGNRYASFLESDMRDTACRVIADHIRTLTFAISDGATPDKDGRGYVLRRILRRGVRYGWQHLGLQEPFLCKLVPAVIDALGEAFPRLGTNPARVIDILRGEEESFGRTLQRGLELFAEAADTARRHHHGEIQGEDVFKLHDTYGFPFDLTEIMALEKGLRINSGEYYRLMEEARQKARSGGKPFSVTESRVPAELVRGLGATDDSAKYAADTLTARVVSIIRLAADDPPVALPAGASLENGEAAAIVLDRTCFYAEQGGQVGDTGEFGGGAIRFDVERVTRLGDVVAHVGTLLFGPLAVGDTVELSVHGRRELIKQNHTATHVLNWALRETLGEHVQQRGSLVDDEKTRFDFAHPRPVTADELVQIESRCAEQIRANLPVFAQEAPQAAAMQINGLRAVFGEKYPDVVRVVSIGAPVADLLRQPENPAWRQFSIEFCGGTHVERTGDIQELVVTEEEAVARGVRRIVAVTGMGAMVASQLGETLVAQAEATLAGVGKSDSETATALASIQHELSTSVIPLRARQRLRDLLAAIQQAQKERQRASAGESAEALYGRLDALAAEAPRHGATLLVVGEVPDVPVDLLRSGADRVRQKHGSTALLLGTRVAAGDGDAAGKVTLLAAVSDDLVKKGVRAGDWVKAVAPTVGGGGGGPPTMAQAGGKSPEKLPDALTAGREWIVARLGA